MKKVVKNATDADIPSVEPDMSIYTKTGDKGTTALYGGKRVLKSSPRVEAYGTVDELTSFIGLVNSKLKNAIDSKLLIEIQKDLHIIMARLSGSAVEVSFLEQRILGFEKKIDTLDKKLTKLTKFIIPGGSEISSMFQVLRVLTRRAERKVVGLTDDKHQLSVKYLNRLSDLFFTLARHYNKKKEILL